MKKTKKTARINVFLEEKYRRLIRKYAGELDLTMGQFIEKAVECYEKSEKFDKKS